MTVVEGGTVLVMKDSKRVLNWGVTDQLLATT